MIICSNEDIKDAAEFYAEKLNIPETCIIAISIHNKMDVAGYCEYHTEEALPYFLLAIELNEGSEEELEDPLAVLAHEMVHVQQYFSGRLQDGETHCMWNGNKYDHFEADTEEYYFSPWEVEAFGLQVGLYRMYCRKLEE